MLQARKYKLALLLFLHCCFYMSSAYGQRHLLYYNQVDTLSFWQRVNFNTNAVDWLLLTPNVGMEIAVGNKNWNRWTVGVHGRLNWNTATKENPYHVYDIYGGRLEVRKYWHAKMPKRVFYLGGYAGVNKFDIKLGSTGKRGQSLVGGLMFGTVTQLYGYQNGSSIDLDLGINAGVVFAKYSEYHRELVADKYVYAETRPEGSYKMTFSPDIYAVSTDILKVSFIYHFGTKLSNRYKKRLLIDNNYRVALETARVRKDSLQRVLEKRRGEITDSLERLDYEKRYERQRLEIEKQYKEDSLRIVNQALKTGQLKDNPKNAGMERDLQKETDMSKQEPVMNAGEGTAPKKDKKKRQKTRKKEAEKAEQQEKTDNEGRKERLAEKEGVEQQMSDSVKNNQ